MRVSFRFTRPVKPGVYFTDVDLPRALQVRDVIFNPPATIVFWEDGMKTVVKCSKDDAYDPERGFELAFLKRVLGGGALRRLIRDWVEPMDRVSRATPTSPCNLEMKREIISESPQQAYRNHLCACNRLRKEQE